MTEPARDEVPGVTVTRGGHVPTGTSADRRARTATSGTAKSERTRESLISAARVVFERSGYLNARVSDIVEEAGLAQGSFYTYFKSLRGVFDAIRAEVSAAIDEAVAHAAEDVLGDAIGNLRRSNRRYLKVHAANARMLAIVDQVASSDPEVLQSRREGRQRHVGRVERTIRHLQERGLADRSLDAHTVAGALVAMLSSFAAWSTINPGEYDEEVVANTVTTIWVRALGMNTTPQKYN